MCERERKGGRGGRKRSVVKEGGRSIYNIMSEKRKREREMERGGGDKYSPMEG